MRPQREFEAEDRKRWQRSRRVRRLDRADSGETLRLSETIDKFQFPTPTWQSIRFEKHSWGEEASTQGGFLKCLEIIRAELLR